MSKLNAVSSAVLLATLACLLVACGGAHGATGAGGGGTGGSGSGGSAGTGNPNCVPYVVPAGTNLMHPAVSFKTDVMGVFNNNCGAPTCHGSGATSMGGLFLGAESAMKSDASKVHAGLVGPTGNELTSMPYVTASDPSKSYLMHKMDGDQCQFDAECVGGTCFAEMPNGLGHVLPAPNRDTVRRWIAQGAQND